MNNLTNKQVVACEKVAIHLKVMSLDSRNMIGRAWKQVGLREGDLEKILHKIEGVYGQKEEISFRNECRDLGVKIKEEATSSSGNLASINRIVSDFMEKNFLPANSAEVPSYSSQEDATKKMSSGPSIHWPNGGSTVA